MILDGFYWLHIRIKFRETNYVFEKLVDGTFRNTQTA
jgi:hypothetical protein